jgi:hypothetical protein
MKMDTSVNARSRKTLLNFLDFLFYSPRILSHYLFLPSFKPNEFLPRKEINGPNEVRYLAAYLGEKRIISYY